MRLDYDELRKIYRLEKNSARLAEVDEDFFDSLSEFFEQQKKDYLQSLTDIQSSKARSFSNLKKIILEIFNTREKKILNKALVASRTGELETSRMASQETETLKQLMLVLNRHQQMLDGVFGTKPGKPARQAGSDRVVVSMTQNVPAFMGADMKEYGPFEKDKKATVPEKIASLLISRKLAEKA